MNQGGFDFSAPVLNPQVESPVVPAPIAPSADLTAKHCSSMGAMKIETARDALWVQMILMYRQEPRTDAEIARYLSWVANREIAPSTITARRHELMKQGIVAEESCGTRKNERTGVSNSLWQLTK